MAAGEAQIDSILDKIGFGRQQAAVLAAGGGCYAFCSFIPLTVGLATAELLEAGRLPRFVNPTSCVFLGYIAGNLLGGYLADGLGRRWPPIFGFASVGLLQAAVSAIGIEGRTAANIFLVLAPALGFCMGMGIAAANAGIREWAPSNWRPRSFAVLFICLTLGQVVAACSLMSLPGEAPWRALFVVGSIIAGLLFLFSTTALPESPHWLLYAGRGAEARKGLSVAAGAMDVRDIDLIDAPAGRHLDIQAKADASTPVLKGAEEPSFMSGRLLVVTLVCSWQGFTMYSCYYGLIYAFPGRDENQSVTPPQLILAAALAELPGLALQFLAGEVLTRAVNLAVMLGLLAASLATLAAGLLWWPALVMPGVLCAKAFSAAAFTVVYLAMTEAYPTSIRGRASSFCMTLGRMGAVLSPIVYEATSPPTFYAGLSVMAVTAAAASWWLVDTLRIEDVHLP